MAVPGSVDALPVNTRKTKRPYRNNLYGLFYKTKAEESEESSLTVLFRPVGNTTLT